jgi:hypothetical protein
MVLHGQGFEIPNRGVANPQFARIQCLELIPKTINLSRGMNASLLHHPVIYSRNLGSLNSFNNSSGNP